MSLLDKALAVERIARKNCVITAEHMELAVAWLRDDINLKQVERALALGGSQPPYSFLARVIRQAFAQGLLIERPKVRE